MVWESIIFDTWIELMRGRITFFVMRPRLVCRNKEIKGSYSMEGKSLYDRKYMLYEIFTFDKS